MGNILSCFREPRDNVQVNKPGTDSPAAGDRSNRMGASPPTSMPRALPVPAQASTPEEEVTTMNESGDQTSFLSTETETSEMEERVRRQRRGRREMAPHSRRIKKRNKKSKAQKPKRQ